MTLPSQLYDNLDQDLRTALLMDGELFARKYTRRKFHSLIQGAENLTLYGEPRDSKEDFLDPLLIPIRLSMNPSEKELKKYGIEEKRDIIAVFSRYLLQVEFGNIVPKVGDRVDHTYIILNDAGVEVERYEQYVFLDVKRTDMFRDTGYFMRYVCLGMKTGMEPED